MTINASEPFGIQRSGDFAGCPMEGMGERAMGCRLYDNCLYEAAVKDWDSFNCEQCRHEGKGAMEFIDPAFVPELEDDPVDEPPEMEMIDPVFSNPFLTSFKENLTYNDETA